MTEMTGGQALVEAIKREGIETIFALPGVQLDAAFDALYDERENIRIVHTRHEQATAYMADGYARTTGKIGTCMVVPGPGLLNASAALSTAYACSSPVLCITGQINSTMIEQGAGQLHEIPHQLEMIGSVTKWAGRAITPQEIPGLVREAFRQIRSGRPRPVEIEIPPDTLAATGDVTLLDPAPVERVAGDPDLLKQAAAALRTAERPLICVGGGVLSAEAWEELRTLAVMLEAPVVMTSNGRGVLSDRHYLAHTGLSGQRLLPEADVILAVGTRFAHPKEWGVPPGATMIRLDADAREVARQPTPTIGIVGDAKAGLAALVAQIDGIGSRPSREKELNALKPDVADQLFALQPQHAFVRAIREEVPDDGILVNDVTQISFFASVGYPLYAPRTMIGPGYQGTLGCGFATALGAQVGNPDKKVVCVSGDGGFMYNVQELATMKHHNIPLIVIVFNDNAFGNVKRIQQQNYRGRMIASDLTNPDFVALARSFGIAGLRAEGPE
ncbi:MAG: thiamine pyrophosphate-binding protein, partial [Chloroflexota bacterium]|nr:thiamine pyrophosphate-binding protein [Chloroflexota bacterium]